MAELLLEIAAGGIPVASPVVEQLPERAPANHAYMLRPESYLRDFDCAPTWHKTLDSALRLAWQLDRDAHTIWSECRWSQNEREQLQTLPPPHIYREGMIFPQGCGRHRDGAPCIYPLTNPHIYAVHFGELAESRRCWPELRDAIFAIRDDTTLQN